MDPGGFATFWPWMRGAHAVSRAPNAVRFRVALSSPLATDAGECTMTAEPGGLGVRMDGVSGRFAGERHRFDVSAGPGWNWVMFTSDASTLSHASAVHRSLVGADAWVAVGMLAYWQAIMVKSSTWQLGP
jgi:hypothetical protein